MSGIAVIPSSFDAYHANAIALAMESRSMSLVRQFHIRTQLRHRVITTTYRRLRYPSQPSIRFHFPSSLRSSRQPSCSSETRRVRRPLMFATAINPR